MMKLQRIVTTLLIALCLAASTTSRAATIAFTPVSSGATGNLNFAGTLGFRFQVNSRIEVTQLGLFDDFSDGHAPTTVRLWTDSGSLLRSSFVTTADPFDGGTISGPGFNGRFRYDTLSSPIVLNPGFYRVAANFGNSGSSFDGMIRRAGSVSSNTDFVSMQQPVQTGSVNGFPSVVSTSSTFGYFGPNFQYNAITSIVVDPNNIGHTDVIEDPTGSATLITNPVPDPLNVPSLGVGYSGDGELMVGNTGQVDVAQNTYVGRLNGSDGKLTITGAGATFDVGEDLFVGDKVGSMGALVVSNQAQINITDDLLVGYEGGTGMATISQNATVTVADGTTIGRTLTSGGQGTLDILSGGILAAEHTVVVGHSNTSQGFLTVDGTNSRMTIGQTSGVGDLFVGNSGMGELTISNSGSTSVANEMIVGRNSSSSGTITITGGILDIGTSGTATDPDLEIGFNGTGVFTQSGGTTTIADELVLGHEATGDGTLDLQGGTINVNDTNGASADIGLRGKGTLKLSAAAIINLAGGMNVGDAGTGTVNQSGGTVTVTDNVILGRISGGVGTLDMTGGTFSAGGFFTIANHNSPGTSAATVLGSGTLLDVEGAIDVGNHGIGTLDIDNDGQVEAGSLSIGSNPTAIGTLTLVDGSLTTANGMHVGNFGEGTAEVSGVTTTVDVGTDVLVGRNLGSDGMMTISNGATLDITDDLLLGLDGGDAVVTIQQNATVNVGDETWVGRRALTGNGVSTLNINSGGELNTTTDLSIGILDANATGHVNINGASSRLDVDGSVYVAGSNTAAGGNGTVTIDDGEVNIANELRIWSGGAVTLSGGRLEASTVNHTAGSFIFNGGELNVDTFNTGSFLTVNGGTLTIGDSPGAMQVNGNFEILAGALEIEIGGTTAGAEFDQLNISAFARFDGPIDINLINGFVPSNGDSFQIVTAGTYVGSPIFDFADADLSSFGLSWDTSEFLSNGTISVIPEPGTVVILAMSLFSLCLVKKNRLFILTLIAVTACFSVTPSQATLIGQWNFNTDFTDSSGNGHHLSSGGSPTIAPGIVGSAVSLNGTSLLTSTAASLTADHTTFSVGAFLQATGDPGPDAVIIGNFDPGGSAFRTGITDHFGKAFAYVGNGGNQTSSSDVLNDGQWHHVVETFDGSTIKLFVDAVLVNSIVSSFASSTPSDQFAIGGSTVSSFGGSNFTGLIDEAFFRTDVLIADDIAHNYSVLFPNRKLVTIDFDTGSVVPGSPDTYQEDGFIVTPNGTDQHLDISDYNGSDSDSEFARHGFGTPAESARFERTGVFDLESLVVENIIGDPNEWQIVSSTGATIDLDSSGVFTFSGPDWEDISYFDITAKTIPNFSGVEIQVDDIQVSYVIPEPSAFVFFILGGLGLIVARRQSGGQNLCVGLAACLLVVVAFSTTSASAAPISITVGDNDGYGFGLPDNGTAIWPGPGGFGENYDGRSPTEVAAADGSQITDSYTTLLPGPGPYPFFTADVFFPFLGTLTSASWTIDMGDFQDRDSIETRYNGILQPGLLDFNDGFQGTAVRTFNLDSAAITNANSAGQFVVTLTRVNDNDWVAFDYFQFDGEVIPEPSTVILSLMGILGYVGFAQRRFSSVQCKAILSLGFLIAVAPLSTSAALIQNFDSAPSDWVQVNNPAGGNNFGFGNSDNTGGLSGAGEAGGTFQRTDQRRLYVDTTIGGSTDLSTPLTFSGELDVTATEIDMNTNIMFGYVNSSDTTSVQPDFVGLVVSEFSGGSTTQYRAWGFLATGTTQFTTAPMLLANNVDRTFDVAWDPVGGSGSGSLSLTVSGPGGNTNSVNLTPAQRVSLSGFNLNAFGFATPILSNPSGAPGTAMVFVDGLQYSAVPEPSTVMLSLMGALGYLAIRRRTGKKES